MLKDLRRSHFLKKNFSFKPCNAVQIKTTLMSGDLSSLSTVLSEQTGLDSQAITSTTNSIKEGIV